MEFKGTKGKWIIDTEESYINESGVLSTPISIKNFMIGFIDVYGDQPEDKANALLISKAPQFYEDALEDLFLFEALLKRIPSNDYTSINLIKERKWLKERLIKEATTL